MAFDRDALYISSAGFGEVHNKLWTYDSSDGIPAITADGYFPTDLLFSRGDFIAVVPGSGSSAWIVVDSISPFIRTSELASGPNPADSITTAMLQDGCVTNDKLASGIDGAKISGNSVPGTSIVTNSLTSSQLDSNSVATAKIQGLAVTTAKLADACVTNSKLAPNSVASGKIAAGAVATVDIADAAVTASKLDPGIITLKYAEEFTTTAAATSQSFAIANATATDKVWAAMSLGTSGMYIEQVTAAAGSVTVTWGGLAPSATDKVVIFGVS